MPQKLGRNDPCHCGSGKKYKKCCLSKDAAAAHKQAASPQTDDKPPQRPAVQPPEPSPIVLYDDDDLDEISNSVVHLIREGKLEEAEKACDELDRRFPEMIDCLERRAMLLEARGESKLAAYYYRRAAEHARTHEGFDPDVADDFLASASQLDPTPENENR
jgi:tetratricopeptide (TPR) repeat protein